jgi:hypothetical protein
LHSRCIGEAIGEIENSSIALRDIDIATPKMPGLVYDASMDRVSAVILYSVASSVSPSAMTFGRKAALSPGLADSLSPQTVAVAGSSS